MFGARGDPIQQRSQMVDRQLRARGIRSEAVLRAMGTVPREHFVPPGQVSSAYRDQALPIAEGQTISQPYMVAVMTEALNLEEGDRVLEIGTGSAYQTAVLAALAREVFSIERLPRLLSEAERTLEEMGIANVRIRLGDGTLGWPGEAPFNAVLVTAGAPDIPPDLKSQLTPNGGRLVIPVGGRSVQNLLRITREGEEYREEELLACRFVPLIGAKGWRSTDQR